jgi:hypothetical protein
MNHSPVNIPNVLYIILGIRGPQLCIECILLIILYGYILRCTHILLVIYNGCI